MISNSKIRQILLLFLIFALFGLIFWNVYPFMAAVLGAYTLYIVLRKPMIYLAEIRKWNRKLAVAVLMFASLIVISLPIYALIALLGNKVVNGLKNSQQILTSVKKVVSDWENRFGIEYLTPERIESLSAWGVSQTTHILNTTLSGLLLLVIAYFILWFMMMGGKKMEQSFFGWLPLRPENVEYVRREMHDLVSSNAIGIPTMGVVQGIAALIGYGLAGIPDLWFWVFMTFIAGMMPIFGVMLAFIPLSMVLFSQGLNGQAVFVLIYGFVVIGSVDNLARMWLLQKIGNTHPLVTLFGVIIGIKLFGFVGFIFGPIMISMFALLVKIYLKEFTKPPAQKTEIETEMEKVRIM